MTANTRRAAYLTKHLQSWAAFFTHDEWMHTLRDLPMADAIEAVLGAAPAWVEPNPLPRRTYNLFTFAPCSMMRLTLTTPPLTRWLTAATTCLRHTNAAKTKPG